MEGKHTFEEVEVPFTFRQSPATLTHSSLECSNSPELEICQVYRQDLPFGCLYGRF